MRENQLSVVLVSCMLAIAAVCAIGSSNAGSLPIQFIKSTLNPVSCPEGLGWDSTSVAEPEVQFDGTRYLMWYQGYQRNGSYGQIGVATSSDGESWTRYAGNPVIRTDQPWKGLTVGGGLTVLFDREDNLYKMWYEGQSDTQNRNIGLATSIDGFTWSDYAGNPVISNGPSTSWTRIINWPSVLKEGGVYKMWIWGSNRDFGGSESGIGLAISTDGIHWQMPEHPLPSLSQEDLIDPFVVKIGSGYHMFLRKGNEIAHASSADGIGWSTDAVPALSLGPAGTWDSNNVRNASVVPLSGMLWMWYAGSSVGFDACVGLASSACSAFDTPGDTIDENCDGVVLCDPTATWKNHGAFVRCVANSASALLDQGLITQEQADAIISEAAQSAVGK
jgi:predicted GH43/DUF377 family glycosyl hydrolase